MTLVVIMGTAHKKIHVLMHYVVVIIIVHVQKLTLGANITHFNSTVVGTIGYVC